MFQQQVNGRGSRVRWLCSRGVCDEIACKIMPYITRLAIVLMIKNLLLLSMGNCCVIVKDQ